MAEVLTLLDAAHDETTGGAFAVLAGRRITFAAFPSGGGTVAAAYEGSLDGTHWFSLGSGNGVVVSDVPVAFIRASYGGSTGVGTVTAQALQGDVDD